MKLLDFPNSLDYDDKLMELSSSLEINKIAEMTQSYLQWCFLL